MHVPKTPFSQSSTEYAVIFHFLLDKYTNVTVCLSNFS